MAYGDKYRLKPGQPEFEITEGILRGRKFVHGREYEFVPQEYRGRFERVSESADDPMTPIDIIPQYTEVDV